MKKKQKKNNQTIMGVDPGLADTGYGIITIEGVAPEVVTYGSVKTHKTLNLPERLYELHKQLSNLIDKHAPHSIAVEELFFFKNAKKVMQVSQARGVILLTIKQKNIPLSEFTPLQIKQTVTGYGRADKKQMQKMIQMTLNMGETPKPDDAADALAVALTAAFWKNH